MMNDKNCQKCERYAGDCCCPDGVATAPDSPWFRCPDGDLLLKKPVANIWIQEEPVGFFRRRIVYHIFIQFQGDDGATWEFIRNTPPAAKSVRSELITALCSTTATPTL